MSFGTSSLPMGCGDRPLLPGRLVRNSATKTRTAEAVVETNGQGAEIRQGKASVKLETNHHDKSLYMYIYIYTYIHKLQKYKYIRYIIHNYVYIT